MGKDSHRPTWDEYFMEIARIASSRRTCLSRAVGSVLVKDKNIIATGYNGSPKGTEHCTDIGCRKKEVRSDEYRERCRGLHAEQNAIIQAALNGADPRGATLYTTIFPCPVCAKQLINAGITRVVYWGEHKAGLAAELLSEAGVELVPYR